MAKKSNTRPATRYGRKVDQSTYRIYQGKEVKPVMYSMQKQNTTGRRNIIAGAIDGVVLMSTTGRPIPYKQIPNER